MLWAVRADVAVDIASELDRLARAEPPVSNLQAPPVYADRYVTLLQGYGATLHRSGGPAFEFPDSLCEPSDVVVINDERVLDHNFRGWVPGEIEAGRAPVMAIVEDGHPVSVCFCARRSETAAEAGVETSESYRRRGFGARVTAAWALAIRESGSIPLYSTSWTNHASVAIARKLKLVAYASDWTLSD